MIISKLIFLRNFLFANEKKVKIILFLMYSAGLIGMINEFSRPLFLQLTSFNLYVSAILLLFFHEKWNKKVVISFVFVIAFGIIIEIIGVKTGKIFGEYNYGNTLGLKLLSVPVAIGFNWLIITYLCCYITQNNLFKKSINQILLAFISAFFMVFIDYLIEPVAVTYDFWYWDNNQIPIKNYMGWFIISFIFSLIFIKNKVIFKNNIAILLLILQVGFFIVHRLFLIHS